MEDKQILKMHSILTQYQILKRNKQFSWSEEYINLWSCYEGHSQKISVKKRGKNNDPYLPTPHQKNKNKKQSFIGKEV